MYYYNYEKRVPQRTNVGAVMGEIVHLIFELLVKTRHTKYYDLIMAGGLKNAPAIEILVIKHLKKHGFYSDQNYFLVEKMIHLGLSLDFYPEKGTIIEPEFRFEIKNENPKYAITGFIDRPIKYDNEKKIAIIDYKTSKRKFSKDKLKSNIQGMIYSLVARHLWPGYKHYVEFVFLQFPSAPVQRVSFKDDELYGLEHYLAILYKKLNNFTEKDAVLNLAKNGENRWLCKAGQTWKCPYLEPFNYFAAFNKEGNIIKSSLVKEDLTNIKDCVKIKQLRHEGCLAWK